MSRGFFGGGGGDGENSRPGQKKSMKNLMDFSTKRKKTQSEMIRDRTTHKMPSYEEMVEKLMDEKMTSTAKGSTFFHLPGTAAPEEREQSKGRDKAIEIYKMKLAKKRSKIRDAKVEVIPKNYSGTGGGWIDKKGKIRNKNGLVVMEVNLTNGVISNHMGMKVGKYNPHSQSNDFKISRLIDKYTVAKGIFNPFGGKQDT